MLSGKSQTPPLEYAEIPNQCADDTSECFTFRNLTFRSVKLHILEFILYSVLSSTPYTPKICNPIEIKFFIR